MIPPTAKTAPTIPTAVGLLPLNNQSIDTPYKGPIDASDILSPKAICINANFSKAGQRNVTNATPKVICNHPFVVSVGNSNHLGILSFLLVSFAVSDSCTVLPVLSI